MSVGDFLRAAWVIEGGFLVPGRPAHKACDLVLTADGVRLRADELEIALRYEDHRVGGDQSVAAGPDVWYLRPWTATRGGDPIGVAVEGHGGYERGVAALRARTRTAFNRFTSRSVDGAVAPLYPAPTISAAVDADRVVVSVLCRTLALRPTWRAALGDPAAVTALLRDVDTKDRRPRPEVTGLRRRTVETLITMRLLGYVHRLAGRPLPDVPLPPDDEVVAAVLNRLIANPTALRPDPDTVAALVHRYYLDVPPWPFDSLMPEPSRRTAG
ncbi:MAG: hypothetical protein KJ792_15895 [Actinobacteria bacterium]|nr:hypothetical protein [Actinomycetota bacterium]MCG2801431.1 hypothetical protein [Cellulomonas sp.]